MRLIYHNVQSHQDLFAIGKSREVNSLSESPKQISIIWKMRGIGFVILSVSLLKKTKDYYFSRILLSDNLKTPK